MSLNVIFAGTPEFASTALKAIIDAGFNVPLVLTQPDRPAGRGMQLQASPVKQCALAHNIPVAQPTSLRIDGKYGEEAKAAMQLLQATPHDVMVVAAYGLILPQIVLDLPKHGCLNIHASLLPRWRGAAPIHRAIEAGDTETGIGIMQMEAGLDTGPIILEERLAIDTKDTTGTLHDKLAVQGARLIVQALQQLARDGALKNTPQAEEGITYAHKITKEEAKLDLNQHAEILARKVRAFNPFPGAVVQLDGQIIKLWQADAVNGQVTALPGALLKADADGVVLACGEGTALRVSQLQKPGGKKISAREFAQSLK